LAGPEAEAYVFTSEAILVRANFSFIKAAKSFLDIFDLLANPIPPNPDFCETLSLSSFVA
jgi:hypothetical protein